MAVIIRSTPYGKRAYPIKPEDAEQLLADGKAKQINRSLYLEMEDEESDHFYGTKMMTADGPKRRGRPPKEAA